MTPEEFRRHGHALVEWVAAYLETVEDRPVRSEVEPGWVRSHLPPSAPEHPEPFEAVVADLDRVVVPALTHWQSPGFFGYFPANTSFAAILGDLVSTGLGVQGMLWSTSPACTEIETHVLDWLVDLLGLPASFRSDGPGGGVIQDSASSAVLCAVLAARERALDGRANVEGLAAAGAGAALVAYGTAEDHSSVEKALRIAGIGSDNFRAVAIDDARAMRPDALAVAVAADRAAGLVPFFCCATVGTTSSMAVDPVAAIAEVCSTEGLWLHVDAAMAGVAAICPELRWVVDGVAGADSFCTNPHKWLGATFDCDAFWVAERAALLRALSILPEYLRNEASEAGSVIDYRDWQVPLGRRFRALKLWFLLRAEGAEGLRAMIRRHVALAAELGEWVESDERFALAAPPRLDLVCLRHVGGDDVTRDLLERLNATGEVFCTHTVLDGTYVIRVCVGSWQTERRHVERLWELLGTLAPTAPPPVG